MLGRSWRGLRTPWRRDCLERCVSSDRAPQGRWSSPEKRRAFLDDFASRNGIQSLSDWAQVSQREVIDAGGAGLLHRFGNSLPRLLRDVYPEAAVASSTLGSRRPRGHWAVSDNRKAFMKRMASSLQLRSPEDWSKLSQSDVRAAGGHGLLSHFNGSLNRTILDSFPELEESLAPRQPRRTRGHWRAVGARREFLLQLAAERGIDTSSPQGWYSLTSTAVRRAGGGGLLAAYGGSLHGALADTFPGLKTKEPAACRQVMPRGYWGRGDATLERAAEFVHSAAQQLGVQHPEDWYRVSAAQIRQVPGCGVLRRVRLGDALARAYPGVDWNSDKLGSRTKRSAQRGLRSCLNLLLPGTQQPRPYATLV